MWENFTSGDGEGTVKIGALGVKEQHGSLPSPLPFLALVLCLPSLYASLNSRLLPRHQTRPSSLWVLPGQSLAPSLGKTVPES